MSEVWKMPQLPGQVAANPPPLAEKPAPTLAPNGGGVVDLTRKLASAILQKAHQQAEEIRQTALTEGRLQGISEGRQQMELELARERQALQEALQTRLQQLEEEQTRHRMELEARVASGLVEALMSLAGVNIGQMLRDNPRALHVSLKEAVSALSVDGSISIRLNPEDAEAIIQDQGFPANWTVHPDAEIERGGFFAQGEQGEIDGQWSAREAHWRSQLAG